MMAKHRHPVFSTALLIAGNAVGAGILALPVKTAMAGVLPSLTAMLLVWMATLATGLILAYRICTVGQSAFSL